jgi:tetratricopeptide (TPR) repeat protein
MPEISPELAARIESLRASHAENPARFFMPLASAYREAGEVGKAEELLRENLKRDIGYLSAHVLLGRCLADRGANAEARHEFGYVLSVDPQNLIALRTLGEMAAASGEPDEARRWFGELLSVDPMNAEAKQSLVALDAAPAVEGGEAGGFGMVEPGAGDAPAADHPAAHADPGTWGEVSLDQHPSFSAGDAPAAGEPAAPSFEALDFGAVDLDAGAEAPADAASDDAPSAEAASAAFESTEPAPAGGFDGWGSVDDGQDEVHAAAVEPLELEEFYGGAEPEPEPAPAAHAEEHDEHEEVVTETIAELYARQGFPERAAGVYRVLIGRRGEEPALVRRLQELEAQIGAAQGGEGDEDRLEPVDLPADDVAAPQAEETPSWLAPAQPEETPSWLAAAQADETPSWLAAVDAVVAGGGAPAEAPAFDDGGMIDFQPDEPQPSAEREPIASVEEPAAAAAAATTGDAFADSFANGFAGVAAPTGRRAWEAPRVEETPVEEASPAAEEQAAPEEPAAGQRGFGESIGSYLSAILAWRPGARADDAAAPPPARPWDEETLGASDEQPPIDEPWIAPDASSADVPAADAPWSAPAPEAEPWAGPSLAEPEPWAAPAEDAAPDAADEAGDDDEELPWLTQPTATPEAEPAPEAEAPMPWETSFELSPEVPEGGPGERAGPRQEPTVEPAGGFSFEEFFSEPAAPAQPAAEPELESEPEPELEPEFEPLPDLLPPPAAAQPAAPAAAPQPPAGEGGDEDEDLESFQAWLQSLKR